jgi:hypothetical protein
MINGTKYRISMSGRLAYIQKIPNAATKRGTKHFFRRRVVSVGVKSGSRRNGCECA